MEIFQRNKATPFITADGSQIRELIHPNFCGVQNQSLAEATLAPGGATTEHYHPRAEEIYYVLQGVARLRIEEQTRDLKAGDAVLIAAGSRHKIWNVGPDDLRFLCCCAPAYSHDDTILTE
ncbi:MAG TPA: cupin domain-containing protein [Abditibacteriaceae bacterium]|jgi:mannose-6-phosphate isomerase-like protein (cupin superfamily)